MSPLADKHIQPAGKAIVITSFAYGVVPFDKWIHVLPILFHRIDKTTGRFVAYRSCGHLFHVLCCIVVIIIVAILQLMQGLHLVYGKVYEKNLSFASLVISFLYNALEAFVALLTSLILAPKICAWANMTDETEDRLHLRGSAEFRKTARNAGFITLLYMVGLSFVHYASSLIFIAFEDSIYGESTTPVKLLTIAYNSVGSLWVYPTSAQPLCYIIYSAFLLKAYVLQISVQVKRILGESPIHFGTACQRLDSCRLTYARLKGMADTMSEIWALSLLISFGGSIPLLCWITYHSTVGDTSIKSKLYFICHGFIMLIKILVPMYIASDIEPAIKLLQRTLLNSRLDMAPNMFLSQIIQFERTLNPELDLKCSGYGFFLVDLQSFTGIVGAIITYSLVVIQGTTSI